MKKLAAKEVETANLQREIKSIKDQIVRLESDQNSV